MGARPERPPRFAEGRGGPAAPAAAAPARAEAAPEAAPEAAVEPTALKELETERPVSETAGDQ